MNDFFKFLISKKFLISLGIAIVLFLLLSYLTLHYLDKYTLHGIEVEVPDLQNLTEETANEALLKDDLRVEIIDSIFSSTLKPGIIIDQKPIAGSKVKKGRKIYVTINSKLTKKVTLPDIVDFPSRQAQAAIEKAGLKVDSIHYIPMDPMDLVLYVESKGKRVTAGDELVIGSSVVLVVGEGISALQKVNMPSFRGLTLSAAQSKALNASIGVAAARFDVEPMSKADESAYVVYKQEPITGSIVNMGEPVKLFLTKDKSKLDAPEELSQDYGNDISVYFDENE